MSAAGHGGGGFALLLLAFRQGLEHLGCGRKPGRRQEAPIDYLLPELDGAEPAAPVGRR